MVANSKKKSLHWNFLKLAIIKNFFFYLNVFNVVAYKHQTHSLVKSSEELSQESSKIQKEKMKKEVLFPLCSVLQTKSLGPLLVVVRTYAALQTQWLLNKSYMSTTNTLLIGFGRFLKISNPFLIFHSLCLL